jgi:hypothetical protein
MRRGAKKPSKKRWRKIRSRKSRSSSSSSRSRRGRRRNRNRNRRITTFVHHNNKLHT